MNLFYQKNFLKLLDFTPAEISKLLVLAAKLKAEKKAGIPHPLCTGKNVALIFEKTSTRTRCAFEVAAADLGMHPVYLDPSGSQIGKKESIADTARVLGRMFDGSEYRGFGQEIVEDLAKYAGVPVWNGLTNEFHPTQILADFLTIQEHFGALKLFAIPVTTSQEHRGRKGSAWVSSSTLFQYIGGIMDSLHSQGFKRVILVLAHGGVIRGDNKPEGGAVFTVTLPMKGESDED